MATVQSMNLIRLTALEDATVIDGYINGSGDLILVQHDSTEINAGSALPLMPDASETVKGKVELATSAETITGTDAVRAVTPAGLQAKVASDTAKGIVELATSAETITGTDTARAVTPAGLQAKVASDTAQGIVELATSAETITGTDTARAVTPAGLQAKVASDTAQGIVELATSAETITGTDTARAVTPAGLSAVLSGIQENKLTATGSTGSTTYTATLTSSTTPQLAFVAPASGKVLIHWGSYIVNSASSGIAYMSWEIRAGSTLGSGSVIVAASDDRAVAQRGDSAGLDDQCSGWSSLVTGLTPGSSYNIQGMFRVTANTGYYGPRNLIVDPR